MGRRGQHILALALSEQGFSLAEVRARRDGAVVMRESVMSVDAPLMSPGASGEALAQHLAEQGYTAKEVVVGLPATRLLARHKLVPQPSDERQLQDMLRLAIERDFTGDGRDLCVDYVKQITNDNRANVLMIAAARDVLERVKQMIAAARLRLRSVTSTLLAVAADDDASSGQSLLMLGDEGAELLIRADSGPIGLTRVSLPAVETGHSPSGALAEAVMRTLAGGVPGMGAASALPAMDVACERGSEAPASEVIAALREWVDVDGPREISPAVALARVSVVDDAPMVDLAHHKLAPEAHPGQARWRRIAALAAVIVLLLTGWGASMGYRGLSHVAALEAEYALIRDEAAALQRVRDRTLAAEPWFTAQAAHLGCLWELTRLFPDDRRIWVNHLRLRADDTGAIQCRAESRQTMIGLLEAMERSPAFADVRLRDWQEVTGAASDGGGEQIRFEIAFRHVINGPHIAGVEH